MLDSAPSIAKSVSFDSLHEKLLFEEDEPASQVLGCETRPISTDNSTKSILKAPLLHVVPTDLPMKPEDYESDGVVRVMGGVDSESSDDDLGFYSSDEEEGQDEDIDFDDDTYAGDSVFFDDDDASEPESVFEQATLEDFQNITGLQEKLDNYMERHPKQAALVNSTLLNYKRNGSRSNERLDAVPAYADLPFLGVPSERQLAAQPASPIVHNPGTKQDAAATPVFTYFGQGIGPLPVSSKTATPLSQSMPTPQNVKSPEDSSDEEDNIPIMQLISPSQHVPVPEKQPAIDATQQIMAKLSEANIRKITTRVYIENSKKYLTKVLTSLMTAGQLVQEVALASDEARWALFELCIDYGIERPLREWEIVTDVLSAWNHSSANAIVVKPYKYKPTLELSYLRGAYPRIQGYLYLKLRPSKWSKRFCILKDHCLYYLSEKDNPQSETLFCNLTSFDIYTSSSTAKPSKKSPTNFTFVLRSDLHPSNFQEKEDYIKVVGVEKEERLVDWVLALRLAKGERMLQVGNSPVPKPELVQHSHSAPPLLNFPAPKLTPGSLLEVRVASLNWRQEETVRRSKRSTRKISKDHNKKRKPKPLVELA
ncbi:hypothetical protein HDV03_001513 [Kappamyces sp. JEL0829]|nr:hypothetical protein HDV03_001513 [Kappamyces sp. JEL0829]